MGLYVNGIRGYEGLYVTAISQSRMRRPEKAGLIIVVRYLNIFVLAIFFRLHPQLLDSKRLSEHL